MMLMFSIRSFLIIFLYSYTATADLIFVTDYNGGEIYASSLSASGPTSLSAVNVTTRNPYAVDYDPEQGYIYWTDTTLNSIIRVRYDGTDQVTVIAGVSDSYGLAIDLASRRVFWTGFFTDRIEVAYLNGTGRSTVVSDNLSTPRAIATDSLHGLLFWTDIGSSGPSSKIERANMDGSNRLTVIGTSLYYPYAIAIDPVGNRIYWCDVYYDTLETSDLFGDFREILIGDSSVGNPYDVAIHAEYLYWTDMLSGKLKRINRYKCDGSEQVGSNVLTGAYGLHVYEVDECSSSPCQNNGTCMDAIDSFQCICREGFAGTLCEEDIDECSSNPCYHGVICVDEVNEYRCQCLPGYNGLLCENEVDECSSSPCQNNGTCLHIIDSFQCSCSEGFSGTFCEEDIDECSSDPCYQGGICVDEVNEYRCQCLPGYSGLFCENDNECENSPCENNAICVDGFVCICQPGFYGLSCETVYICDKSICDEGDTCISNGQEHICYNNNNNDVNTTVTSGTVLGYYIAEGLLVVIVAIIIIAAIVFAYKRCKRYNQQKKIMKGSDSINMTVKDDGDNYDDVIVDTMATRAGRDAHNLNPVNTADPQYINKIETKTQQVADSSYEGLHTYSNIGAVYTDLK